MADRTPTTAQFIAANPAHYSDRPWLYATAWGILLAARGRTLNPETAGPAAHLIARPDLSDRIRAHASSIGWPERRTLRCPGART
ncbi:hypothetical protein ACFO5X_06345 [Seohaeicola nanhaiensis]|uniref:Uncharacterized protein n=1 Tax=Seohaeicola nanhaiensis TaxID=1387282 RepID=A0ABV9KE42_9RHOB